MIQLTKVLGLLTLISQHYVVFSMQLIGLIVLRICTTTFHVSSNCWDAVQPTGSFYDWNITGTGTTGSGGTGAPSAHSGVKYFYTEASSGTAVIVRFYTLQLLILIPQVQVWNSGITCMVLIWEVFILKYMTQHGLF